ncbi:MAG TPA: DUF2846 domain-containing protein [Stellaceae bacterium]|nr:DUF2846 domain-containing protein [Stellaceae bacterium]
MLGLSSCAPPGAPYGSVAATVPAVPAGSARIYFYRELEIYDSTTPTEAYLNGAPVGLTETGTVFYRDVAPGQYTISVRSYGIFPYQFKTVVLRPGEIAYARIESLRSWVPCGGGGGRDGGGSTSGCENTFVVVMIDPQLAVGDMRDLRFISG